jgi:hypothetical protein
MSYEDEDLCPECQAKLKAGYDRLAEVARELAPDLDPEQLVQLLIDVAGSLAGATKMPPGAFMSSVRQTVYDEWGLTITGVAFNSPDFATEGEA